MAAHYYQPKLSLLEGAALYTQLRKEVEDSKILDRDYAYYGALLFIVFAGFFSSVYFFIIANSFFPALLSCLFIVIFAAQLAGIFHDAGHRAIFRSAKNNDVIGYFCCALLAYTYKKWKINHNRHHANPNEEEMDPDVERPVFSFNEKQMKEKKGLWYFFSKHQTYLYYPVGALTGIYSQLANIFYFIRERNETKYWEKLLYVIGIFAWIGGPILFFPAGKALTMYLTVYPLFGLYLFNVFAPNHKGMPQIQEGQSISFLEQQIVTSRNITGGFFTDIFILGLNYQTGHHLFPHCPRNKLKLLTPFVKKICKEAGLPYSETNFIESNKIILRELNSVSVAG